MNDNITFDEKQRREQANFNRLHTPSKYRIYDDKQTRLIRKYLTDNLPKVFNQCDSIRAAKRLIYSTVHAGHVCRTTGAIVNWFDSDQIMAWTAHLDDNYELAKLINSSRARPPKQGHTTFALMTKLKNRGIPPLSSNRNSTAPTRSRKQEVSHRVWDADGNDVGVKSHPHNADSNNDNNDNSSFISSNTEDVSVSKIVKTVTSTNNQRKPCYEQTIVDIVAPIDSVLCIEKPKWLRKPKVVAGNDTHFIDCFPFLQDNEVSLLYAQEGQGKSTWQRILDHYLLEAGYEVVVFTEDIVTFRRDMELIHGESDRLNIVGIGDIESIEKLKEMLKELADWWIKASNGRKLYLCVDTLTRLQGQLNLSANQPEQMNQVLSTFTRFRDYCARKGSITHTCLTYHSKKNDPRTYSGAKEISNQCNTRMLLSSDQENWTTTIELVSSRTLDAGEAFMFKLTNRKKINERYSPPTRWEIKSASAGASEKSAAKEDIVNHRQAYAAVCWWAANKPSPPYQKDILRLCGWGNKRGQDILYQLFSSGLTDKYSGKIQATSVGSLKPDQVDHAVNDAFEDDKLPRVSCAIREDENGVERLHLVPAQRQPDG